MWLPSGQAKSVSPTRIRYILTGVYFHRNSSIYNASIGTFGFHSTIGVDKENTINVYDMPVPTSASGVTPNLNALPSQYLVKCENYPSYLLSPEWLAHCAQVMNHEIGHVMNLDHSWNSPNESDNCLDTPPNPNCWVNSSSPPCDSWVNISNNIMDYTQWYPHAYSPCQVTRIQNYLNGPNGNYLIHSCNGCTPSHSFIWLEPEICVLPAKFATVKLNCQGSYNVNRYLLEICEVNTMNSYDCAGGYFNSGWINGTPNIISLASIYNFQPNKYYKIKLSGDNTDCPSLSSSQIVFRSKDCQEYSVSDPTIIKNPIVAPNPGNGARTLTFELTSQANVNIYVVNGTTGNIASQVVNNFGFLPGIQTVSIGEESLPIGQHYITITAGSNIISLPFTKQ